MWLSFLQEYNGVSLITPLRDVSYSHEAFTTDASDWGFAAVFHTEWFQAQWPVGWKEKNINLWEFVPIWLALWVWGDNWRHAFMIFHGDNQAVVEVINRLSSRDPGMLTILREIVQLYLHQDCIFQAKHCPGRLNIVADFLSHSQPDRSFLLRHILQMHPVVPPTQMLLLIAPYASC